MDGVRWKEESGNLAAEAAGRQDVPVKGEGFGRFVQETVSARSESSAMTGGTLLTLQPGTGDEKKETEALKIYESVRRGEGNPIKNLRTVSKVPYGGLAKDGVIHYKGVVFVCDERTNSICLGDMSDPKQVLNITLSGGGHLKVNRDSIGQLSRAIGMFSPEDVNLILRAIHQDTKIQSMQKEIDDLEAEAGELGDSGREKPEDA